jgi:integrase
VLRSCSVALVAEGVISMLALPAPAIEAGGIAKPARVYDLRSTFASRALAARISVFELARIMGTSIAMIERHYGTLIEGANADIARRLDAFAASR